MTSQVVTFLIHVVGEKAPRPIVCDSAETAHSEAALLGLNRRLYTVVEHRSGRHKSMPGPRPNDAGQMVGTTPAER